MSVPVISPAEAWKILSLEIRLMLPPVTVAFRVISAMVVSVASPVESRMLPEALMPLASLPPVMVMKPFIVVRMRSAPLTRSSCACMTVATLP